MEVVDLMQHLNEKEHPQSELMKKNLQDVKDSVIKGFKNIIGNKNIKFIYIKIIELFFYNK